jgi:UDP-glucose 4-epimerase
MKSVLVTGGAGFIGSNIVKGLIEIGLTVRVLDNLSTGYEQNIPSSDNVTFIHGDIRDETALTKALQGVDTIFHLAASVGNRRSLENPLMDAEINVIGTLRLLERARLAKVKKIVFTSSAAIFGELRILPIREDHPISPDSFYGASKFTAERDCLIYGALHGISVTCLRPFNVYGPNQRYDAYGNVIPIFGSLILQGKKLVIYGDGEQTRDFINVHDVVQANLLGARIDCTGAFNLASGTQITINKLAALIQEVAGKDVGVEYAAPRLGDVRHSKGDISAAQRILGFRPSVSIEKGLREYMDWLKNDQIAQMQLSPTARD